MTIAVCYRSPEGIVLGADSTASFGDHYFNHTQKLFEIGEDSTLGLLTWNLGGFGPVSYRTLVAELSDQLKLQPPASVDEVAARWGAHVWAAYTGGVFGSAIRRCQQLAAQPPFDPSAAAQVAGSRTEQEEAEFRDLKLRLFVGFCIGGYVLPDRSLKAFKIELDPLEQTPRISETGMQCEFWGAPNLILRLIHGIDGYLFNDIVSSPHWTGSENDLGVLVQNHALSHGAIPIRDAIDFVHTSIASTIKALKFSNLPQICGGPIELAVITSDRRFRWVRHKGWDDAIH